MATLTIRNLPDEVRDRLRVVAAQNGHSMEEEVRRILERAVTDMTSSELVKLVQELFGQEHGVELELPSRESGREPSDFSDDVYGIRDAVTHRDKDMK